MRKLFCTLLLALLLTSIVPAEQTYAQDASPFLVIGFVTDSDDQPIQGVDINASGATNGPWDDSITMANGFYQVEMRFEDLSIGETVWIDATYGNLSAIGSVVFSSNDNFAWLNLTIVSSFYFIKGIVSDLDGAPIVDASVNVTDDTDDLNPLWGEVITDAEGKYSVAFPINLMHNSQHPIEIDATYGNISKWTTITYDPGQVVGWLNLTMDTPYYVRGIVRGQDGAPIEGVTVDVLEESTGAYDGVTTLSNGLYEARLYDFNNNASISIRGSYRGGEDTAMSTINTTNGVSWSNLSIASDIDLDSTLDNLAVEPGAMVNLTISVENQGNLNTSMLYVNVSSPLAWEDDTVSSGVSLVGLLRYNVSTTVGTEHTIQAVFSTPSGDLDGTIYPISISVEGTDLANFTIPTVWYNHTVAITKATLSPQLTPREAVLPWGETIVSNLNITNHGSQEARWLWIDAALPATLVGSSLNYTFQNVGSNTLVDIPLNLTLAQSTANDTEIEVVWHVKFTNSSAGGIVDLTLTTTLTVHALIVESQVTYDSVVKGDAEFLVNVDITAMNQAIPYMIWANLSAPDLTVLENATMVFQNTSTAQYSAAFYVPLLPSGSPIPFNINIEAVAENGWKAEPRNTSHALLPYYHYIQGSITDIDGNWSGPVELTNLATGETLYSDAVDGLYRFDITLLSNTSYPGDPLAVFANDLVWETNIGEGPVQQLDIELGPPDLPQTSWYEEPLYLLGALVLIIVLVLLVLLLLTRRKKLSEAEHHENGTANKVEKK